MEHKWKIDMFDGVNYQTWNTIIGIFFLREYLWSDINGTSLRPTTPTHQSTWDSKDKNSRLILQWNMKEIKRVHVKSSKIKKLAWDAFKNQITS